MQLVAYGAQDIYLTGSPTITYFKVVYRRHTNFAMESIEQTLNGTASFGGKVTALISRNGDLISGMGVELTLPALAAYQRWTDNVGHHLLDQVEIEIGGQLIDRHYSDWLEIWSQLTVPAGKRVGYLETIGQSPKDNKGQPTGLQRISNAATASKKIYVPLQFWFCRNVGLSLPLIALQYHEVKVNIQFKQASQVCHLAAGGDIAAANLPAASSLNASLWVDYIYLDTDERRRFAQVSHEYLIEQLQFSGNEAFTGVGTVDVNLNLNHPVKELVWVARYTDHESNKQWSNYSTTGALAVATNPIDPTVTLLGAGAAGAAVSVAITTGALVAAGGGFQRDAVLDDIVIIDGIGYTVTTAGTSGNARVAPIPAAQVNSTNGLTTYITPNSVVSRINLATSAVSSTGQDYTRPTRLTTGELAGNPVTSAILKLNGHDRFAVRDGDYFNRVQPLNAHTNVPASPGINVYSFAIKPEEHQPSGTCNFSRIDNAKLSLTLQAGWDDAGVLRTAPTGNVKVFATNYNVLRIMSGMGGLAYSN